MRTCSFGNKIGKEKKELLIDLTAGFPLPRKLDTSYYIPVTDALDPKDLPDRFIRVTGKDKYQYGIALGYSLFMGCTAKDHAPGQRNIIYHIYKYLIIVIVKSLYISFYTIIVIPICYFC